MTLWVEDVLSQAAVGVETARLDRLQGALFAGGAFDFSYDESKTLTAREAFAERRGNCLSFTVLFVALSRSAGVDTFLVNVEREPEIDRVDDLVIVNRHVVAGYRSGRGMATYDFAIASDAVVSNRRIIDDLRASAMYHANLGGAELRVGDPAAALHHLEIATSLAPDWAPGWVNLGVALVHLDRIDEAFAAYRTALDVDPEDGSALNNLSALFARLGRAEEARQALRAAAERTESPFTLIAVADAEIISGRLDSAARYLRRAKRWHSKVPEVHEALARLAEATGDPGRAAKHRDRAERLRLRRSVE
jgi:Flp pilus assembly protein TadD